jgi:predicted phosphodiesterase
MYKYSHFISQNIAPKDATKIAVYDKSGNKIYDMPLNKLAQPTEDKLYSFGLISDIHLWKTMSSWNGNDKFDNALDYFEKENCIMCLHCGDFTQTGLYDEGDKNTLVPSQFEKYKEICDKHSIPVYGLCGNHESYMNPITKNITELKYYTNIDLYYTVTQNNDIFIFLSQPDYNSVMSDEALQWLYETLEENRNKRCFVFVHPYMEEDSGDPLDLRENSIFEMWGTAKTTIFKNILKHYKNTILFHGHSHMKFEHQAVDINANYTERNGFKSVNASSAGKPRNIDTTSTNTTPDDNDGSQGYIVDVYDNFVILNGINLITHEPVPLGTYKIDTTIKQIDANTFVDTTGTIDTNK